MIMALEIIMKIFLFLSDNTLFIFGFFNILSGNHHLCYIAQW